MKKILSILVCVLIICFMSLSVSAVEVETQDAEISDSFSQLLSPTFVTALVSVVSMLAAIFKLVASNIKIQKEKTKTIDDAIEAYKEVLEEKFKKASEDAIKSFTEPVTNMIEQNSEITKGFAKILALSQENTPQAKLAILELIGNLNIIDKKVTEQAIAVVEKEIEDDKAKEEENAQVIEEIIKPVE